MIQFFELKGKVITAIRNLAVDSDDYTLFTAGHQLHFYHEQDCCETVKVAAIRGNISDIIGHTITLAEEDNPSEDPDVTPDYESQTITKYILETSKGRLEIVWDGVSNGYYSESVTMNIKPV